MSTSTGPAYRIKQGTNIFTIPYQLDKVREQQKIALAQEFLNSVTSSFLIQSIQDDVPKTFNEMVKTVSRELSGIKNLKDVSFSDDYFFLSKLMNGKILFHYNPMRDETYVRLINFTDKADFLFSKLDFVDKNMEYYDGSDGQLEYLTEEQWEDLKECWNEVDTLKFSYPTVPQVELLDTGVIRSSCLSSLALNEFFSHLVWKSGDEQLSEVFQLKMGKSFSSPTVTDGDMSTLWANVAAIHRYRFQDDNRDVFDEIPEMLNIVDEVREETFKWVYANPLIFERTT